MTYRQKFIRFSQAVLILAGGILLVAPASYFPSYYNPPLMAVVAFLNCFFIQLPVLVFRIPKGSSVSAKEEKTVVREQLQMAFSLGVLLAGLGSLGLWGLYQVGIPYDKIVHFIFSTLVMVTGVHVLRLWYGWPLKKATILLALIIGLSGIAWEYTEFLSDRWLHFGFFGGLFDRDSLTDIVFNVSGIVAGVIVIVRRHTLWK